MRHLIAFVLLASPALAAEPSPEALALQKQLRAAVAEAEKSVVAVSISKSERYRDFRAAPADPLSGRLGGFDSSPFLRNPFETIERRELARRLDLSLDGAVPDAFATGSALDDKGLILVPAHAVRDARKIFVRFGDGEGGYADIHAADPRSDLAVLKMFGARVLPPGLKRGDATGLRKGDFVFGLACSPGDGFRDGGAAVTFGVVGGLRRRPPGPVKEMERTQPLYRYGTLIQTDLRLPPTYSGVPVFDLAGRWVGVGTALAVLTGGDGAPAFAQPLDAVMNRVIDRLMLGEEVEYGLLGVSMSLRDGRESGGVRVADVSPGSPAERVGLMAGDRIIGVNDVAIEDGDDLFLRVGGLLCGTEARIKYIRNGREGVTPAVRLSRLAMPPNPIWRPNPPSFLGLRVEPASVISLRNLPEGVAVAELVPNSPAVAALAGNKDGIRLIIEKVDGEAVRTPREFFEAVRGKNQATLTVVDAVENFAGTRRVVTLGGD